MVSNYHDLVDFVSEEATRAARSIAGYLGGELAASKYPVTVGSNLKYAVPNYFSPGVKTQFSFRPLIVSDSAELLAMQNGRIIWSRDLKFVRPAEMLSAELEAGEGELIFNLMHKEQKTWQL